MNGVAIFLCDITGKMAEPWIRSGYDVILVDPQHSKGITREANYKCGHTHIRNPERNLHCEICVAAGKPLGNGIRSLGTSTIKVGYVLNHPETWRVIREAIQTGRVVFVAGFPPCTDVAVCGTKNFASKFAKDKHFQAKAALVAEQCRVIGQLSGAPWFFENPISVFSSIFGKPDHIFSPYQYTDLCRDDNYFKSTCLWTGNGFVMPDAQMEPVVKATTEMVLERLGRLWSDKKKMLKAHADKFNEVELEWINKFYPDDRIHKAAPGEDRANFRSATPRGFAKAVFEANHTDYRMREILE